MSLLSFNELRCQIFKLKHNRIKLLTITRNVKFILSYYKLIKHAIDNVPTIKWIGYGYRAEICLRKTTQWGLIWFSKLFYSANIKKEDHNDSKYSILVNTPNGRWGSFFVSNSIYQHSFVDCLPLTNWRSTRVISEILRRS